VSCSCNCLLICSTSTTPDDRPRSPVPVRHNIQPSVATAGQTDVPPTEGRHEPWWSFHHRGPRPDAAPRSRGGGTELGRGRAGVGAVVPAWRPVVGMPWRTIVSTTVHRQVVHAAGGPPQLEDQTATGTGTSARRSLSWDVPTTASHRLPRQPFTSTSTQVNTLHLSNNHCYLFTFTQVSTLHFSQYSLLPVHIHTGEHSSLLPVLTVTCTPGVL